MLWWYVAALDVVQQKLGHYFAKYVADYCHFRYWNFCRKRSLLFSSRCQEKDSLKLVEHLVTIQILYQELSIFVYANMFVDGIEEGMYAFLPSWEVHLTFYLLSVSQIIQWKVCLLGWHFFVHWCSSMPAKVCLLEWHSSSTASFQCCGQEIIVVGALWNVQIFLFFLIYVFDTRGT